MEERGVIVDYDLPDPDEFINSLERKKQKKKEKKEEGDDFVFRGLVVDWENKKIAEQVYNKDGCTFAIYDNSSGTVEYADYFQVDNINYKPFPAATHQEIYKEALLLPEHAEEYESDEKLDSIIMDFIRKWLDIPEDLLLFALWNIKRAWVYDRFHTLNYLRALGDTGQGKTRFLDVLGYLHYKPISTSGATTAAPVFRIIEKWHGTLIMDEADFGKSDETQDMIKIINCGYERGKHILRCEHDNPSAVGLFDAYGPKILATRKTFKDKATESRCITHVMTGTRRKDILYNLNSDFFKEAQKIRNQLLMWRLKNFFEISPDAKIDFDLGVLEPRVHQIVTSFVALFVNDPKQMEKFKDFIQRHQENIIDERRNSFEGEIIGAIHKLVSAGVTDFSAQDIIDSSELLSYDGKPLRSRVLSTKLRALGFDKSVMKKVDGKVKRCVQFTGEQLQNLFERYGFGGNEVTIVTQDLKSPPKAKLTDFQNSAGHGIDRYDRYFVTNKNKENTPISGVCNYCGVTKKLTHKVDGHLACEECFLLESSTEESDMGD